MIDVKTQGLLVKILPNSSKDMELLDDHKIIGHIIPKGFVFDGASCIDEDNNVKCASLIHDYYYRMTEHNFTKDDVDEMFYLAMLDMGVSEAVATAVKVGVVLGAGPVWYKQQTTKNPNLK